MFDCAQTNWVAFTSMRAHGSVKHARTHGTLQNPNAFHVKWYAFLSRAVELVAIWGIAGLQPRESAVAEICGRGLRRSATGLLRIVHSIKRAAATSISFAAPFASAANRSTTIRIACSPDTWGIMACIWLSIFLGHIRGRSLNKMTPLLLALMCSYGSELLES